MLQGASESLFILSTNTGLTQLESLVKVHIGGESLFSPCVWRILDWGSGDLGSLLGQPHRLRGVPGSFDDAGSIDKAAVQVFPPTACFQPSLADPLGAYVDMGRERIT